MDTPEGRGTVTDVDVLRQRVKVRMEENPDTISLFSVEDIAVLRSGKAKKNDPPIPADLAPISGSGKRVRKEAQEEAPIVLDPIRFRYSTESVVEEAPASAVEEAVQEKEPETRRSSQRRRRRPKDSERVPKEQSPAPKPEKKAPKVEKAPAPRQEKPEKAASAPKDEGEVKKPHRRRPNYRRRSGKSKSNPEG